MLLPFPTETAVAALTAAAAVWGIATVATLLAGVRFAGRRAPGGAAAILGGVLGLAALAAAIVPAQRWVGGGSLRLSHWPREATALAAAAGLLWASQQAAVVWAVGAAWRRLDAAGEDFHDAPRPGATS